MKLSALVLGILALFLFGILLVKPAVNVNVSIFKVNIAAYFYAAAWSPIAYGISFAIAILIIGVILLIVGLM